MVIAVQLSDLAVKWPAVSRSWEGGEPGEANGTAVWLHWTVQSLGSMRVWATGQTHKHLTFVNISEGVTACRRRSAGTEHTWPDHLFDFVVKTPYNYYLCWQSRRVKASKCRWLEMAVTTTYTNLSQTHISSDPTPTELPRQHFKVNMKSRLEIDFLNNSPLRYCECSISDI